MADSRQTLKVSERELMGSRNSRRLRHNGLVPGVVYGDGSEAISFQVDARELRAFLIAGQTLFDLQIGDGDAVPVVIKERQVHPVRGETTHLDCLEVNLKVAIQADVAIELVGAEEAPGVKEGGILEHVGREVTVEALPADIPEQLEADVSAMEINDTMTLSSIEPPENVKFMVDDFEEFTIVTLSPPRLEEEPEPDLEEETEVIGEGEEAEGEPDGDAGDGDAGAPQEGDSGDEG